MKKYFAILWVAAVQLVATAQTPEEKIYRAYLSQQIETSLWKEAVSIRQAAAKKSPQDTRARFQLALAQFALISGTMRNQDEDLFDEYYDPLLDNLKAISEKDKNWAEPYALQSAAYGIKMGYSPMQGMVLGGKSDNLIEKAKRLDPNSALAWKVYANAKFFTPEMWGGDLDEAIAGYEKALQLYESKPETLPYNWMYLDTMAFLGQALLKKGERAKAIAIYEKALKTEPEFGWVKFVLLPKAKSNK
jgi:tetratricopeptide (TPR) repeat protein